MGINFRCYDGHSIHFAFDHSAYTDGHAVRVVISVGDNHFVSAMNRGEFKTFYQLRKEWIHNVGDNQAEHSRFPQNQRPSLRIGVVTQLADDAPYFFGGPGTDEIALIYGP